MAETSEFDFIQRVSELSHERLLVFYESLAHNLTISVRVVSDDDARTDTQRLSAVRCLNEILHRVISQNTVVRTDSRKLSESEMLEEIKRWVRLDRSISGDVGWAIRRGFEVATSGGRPT